jgi:hypothetical protein
MAIDIAGSQILSQPVSGFLQGRAMRMAEEQGERRMRALEAAEGRAAAQESRLASAEQREQQLFDEASKMRNMQVLHRALSQIESAEDPAAALNTLAKSPEVSGIFQKMGKDPMEGWGTTPDEIRARAAEGRAQIEPFLPKSKAEPLSKEGKIAADVKSGLLTKEQGDAALSGTNKEPSDIQVYKFAQSQGYKGSYVDFKKELRGKGLSMTLPDGTTISMGEPGGQIGPGELSKPTINNLQETIVNSTGRLDRLNQMLATYKPEFLQAKGILQAGASELKDFLGMDLNPDQRKFLSDYSEFQANSAQEFNATLKELSGVAVSESELARAMQGAPSANDKSPAKFEAKARATTKFVTRSIMRANWALKNGIGVKSVDQLAKVMPLEGVDAVYEQRANEIWQELGGTSEAKAQAIKQANEEFGLAR